MDHPVQPAPSTSADPLKKRRLAGLLLAAVGLLGNLVIYILSRIIAVTVTTTYHIDQIQQSYQSNETIHSWKYFIQVYDLDVLTALLCFLLVGGVGLFLVSWPPVHSKLFD